MHHDVQRAHRGAHIINKSSEPDSTGESELRFQRTQFSHRILAAARLIYGRANYVSADRYASRQRRERAQKYFVPFPSREGRDQTHANSSRGRGASPESSSSGATLPSGLNRSRLTAL